MRYHLYLPRVSKVHQTALAQPSIQTIKYRNLVIDLGNGVKTNAQLTFPTVGKGPFPGVLLISGSGANDKNGTLGFVHKNGPKPPTPLWQIAKYLTERGFAVSHPNKPLRVSGFSIGLFVKVFIGSTLAFVALTF